MSRLHDRARPRARDVGTTHLSWPVHNCASHRLRSCARQLISTAAPPQRVGAVNGASMSAASLCRATGPSAAGAIIAWSLNNGLPFPVDYWCSFLVSGSVYATIAYLTLRIREPEDLG